MDRVQEQERERKPTFVEWGGIILMALLALTGLVAVVSDLRDLEVEQVVNQEQLAIDWTRGLGYTPVGATCLNVVDGRITLRCSVSVMELDDPLPIDCIAMMGECELGKDRSR